MQFFHVALASTGRRMISVVLQIHFHHNIITIITTSQYVNSIRPPTSPGAGGVTSSDLFFGPRSAL